MVFNATFINISVISWQTVLLVEACSGFFKGQYLRLGLWCLTPLS